MNKLERGFKSGRLRFGFGKGAAKIGTCGLAIAVAEMIWQAARCRRVSKHIRQKKVHISRITVPGKTYQSLFVVLGDLSNLPELAASFRRMGGAEIQGQAFILESETFLGRRSTSRRQFFFGLSSLKS